MKVIKLPKMSEEEIRKAINSHNLCRIAFIDDDFPYISPFQYVCIDNTLYFHFTDYGKKKEILSRNPNICVSIEKFEPDLSSYYFISMQGILKIIDDAKLKNKVINQMVQIARESFSTNFLSAHGFEKKEGWDNFKTKDQIIYKFELIGKPIGLKSF
jgi:nitroimidazol reductase NimA-like FMN-containing flavoprotein (pyridoxamine 5'-phosphate oxidase superfamily)